MAHPSHGRVGIIGGGGGKGGVIPGMVKLSEGVLVNLPLVFPFQAIITAHLPCACMPSYVIQEETRNHWGPCITLCSLG